MSRFGFISPRLTLALERIKDRRDVIVECSLVRRRSGMPPDDRSFLDAHGVDLLWSSMRTYMGAIQSLSIEASFLDLEFVVGALDVAAPFLQHLEICVYWPRNESRLSGRILASYAPRLVSVKLVGVLPPADLSIFNNVHTLSLEGPPTGANIILLLHSLPALQICHLFDQRVDAGSFDHMPLAGVPSRLSILRIESLRSYPYAVAMSLIVCPRVTLVRCKCPFWIESGGYFLPFLQSLSDISYLVLRRTSLMTAACAAATSSRDAERMTSELDQDINQPSALNLFQLCFALQSVQFMVIDGGIVESWSAWRIEAPNITLPYLRYLQIVIGVYGDNANPATVQLDPPPLFLTCPNLNVLRFTLLPDELLKGSSPEVWDDDLPRRFMDTLRLGAVAPVWLEVEAYGDIRADVPDFPNTRRRAVTKPSPLRALETVNWWEDTLTNRWEDKFAEILQSMPDSSDFDL
ncbi:hypothetical protein EXIGLDRAFT_732079 [Exidia glandulosa HHB12029]|uniref:F-box domain-containing protein n=1 Tax=Exidia glandulosa HHB12029 TaxID=1314781 RepID=A0A165BN87_EXIGL|nr:hypothetical protein EXIGLDRAFT_732079 [Exidia glandulosa HHB12029]